MPSTERIIRFNLFKRNVCHRLKALGDVTFAIELLEKDLIHHCFERGEYLEGFYLLGMLDLICHTHQIPLPSNYNDLRKMKQ